MLVDVEFSVDSIADLLNNTLCSVILSSDTINMFNSLSDEFGFATVAYAIDSRYSSVTEFDYEFYEYSYEELVALLGLSD